MLSQVQTAPAIAAVPGGRARRIVFVINAEITGGAERHAAALAGGLEARGFRTDVFALRGAGVEPFARRLVALRAFVAERNCDLVVAVNERPVAAAVLAGFGGKAKIVGVLHSTRPRNARELFVRLAHLPALYALDGLIFVSRRQRAYWRRTGMFGKAQTIPNGVDVARFTPQARQNLRAGMRAALGFAEDDVVAAFCAVLRPEKNPGQFVEAVAALRREGAPVRGLIVGDGPCAAALRAQIAALSLDGAVTLMGMQQDVRPYLAAADFGVNCSVAIETSSLAALETMAMGLPMAMSDIGGAGEIVDQDCGVLFARGDLKGLTAAMRSLLDPRRRRDAGLAARARVVAEFDETRMFDRYAENFLALLG